MSVEKAGYVSFPLERINGLLPKLNKKISLVIREIS